MESAWVCAQAQSAVPQRAARIKNGAALVCLIDAFRAGDERNLAKAA